MLVQEPAFNDTLEKGYAHPDHPHTRVSNTKLSYTTLTFLTFLFSLGFWTFLTDTPQWSLLELFLLALHPIMLLYVYHSIDGATFVVCPPTDHPPCRVWTIGSPR